jgi:hypothetical protein
MDAMLRHVGAGHDLTEFPGTVTEKLALVWTAGARGLIEWNRRRSRYELTPIGWSKLTSGRMIDLRSLILSAAAGVTVTGTVMGIIFSINTSDRFADRWPTTPASNAKYALLHPADPNPTPPLMAVNVVREIPSPVAPEPPVVFEDQTELAVAEKPLVEEAKDEPAPTAAKETKVAAKETEVKKHRRKKFSHRRRHHAKHRYAYATPTNDPGESPRTISVRGPVT